MELSILTKINKNMKKTTTRTFSISDDVYNKFDKIIKSNKINKSKLIESFIIKFIEDIEKTFKNKI